MILDTVNKSLRIDISSGGAAATTLLSLPNSYIVDPNDVFDNTHFSGTQIFGWDQRDGNSPYFGPTLTARGSPTSTAGPHTLQAGTRLNLETIGAGNGRLSTTNGISPTSDTADLIVALNVMAPKGSGTLAAGEYIISGYDTSTSVGWIVFVATGASAFSFYYATLSALWGNHTLFNYTPNSMNSFVVLVNRNGNIDCVHNNTVTSAIAAMQSGSLTASCVGLGCNAKSADTSYTGSIENLMVWSGEGIYEDWSADSYQMCKDWINLSTGVFTEEGLGNHTRATGNASWISDLVGETGRKYFIGNEGYPRAGDPGLLRAGPSKENDTYANINPSATTGWTKAGDGAATLTVVDDSSELDTILEPDGDTVDGTAWGPNVYKLDNSAGTGAALAYSGPTTGNLSIRSFQCIARCTAGTCQMGAFDNSSGGFTSYATIDTTTYEHYIAPNKTPGDTDEYYAFVAYPGGVVYFIATQRELGVVCTSIIPNTSTGGAVTRAQDLVTTTVDIIDENAQIDVTVIPLHWGDGDPTSDCAIIDTASGDDLLYYDSAGNWESNDGTNTLTVAYAHTAYEVIAASLVWYVTQQGLTVEGTVDNGAYVGARAGGAVRIAPTNVETAVALTLSTLASAASPFFVSWVDHENDTIEPPESDCGDLVAGMPNTIVPAPAASHSRQILLLNLYCNDPVGGVEISVNVDDNGTEYSLYRTLLDYMEVLSWSIHTGWVVTNANGDIRSTELLPGYDAQAEAFKVFQVNKDIGRSDILSNFTTANATDTDTYLLDSSGLQMVGAGYHNLSLTVYLNITSGTEIRVTVEATNDIFLDPSACKWNVLYGFCPNIPLTGSYWVNEITTTSGEVTAQWDFDSLNVARARVRLIFNGAGSAFISATRS